MAQSELPAISDAIWALASSRKAAKSIRLVLIDDHPIVREGICALLGLEKRHDRGRRWPGDMETGIEQVRRHQPDLVICDLTMPGCHRHPSRCAKLCHECPTMRVLVLSAQDSLECIRESFAAGAIGYVRKDALRAGFFWAAVAPCRDGARQAVCLGRQRHADAKTGCSKAGNGPRRPPMRRSKPEDRQILRPLFQFCARSTPPGVSRADLRRGVKVVEKYRRQSDAPPQLEQHCRRYPDMR